MQLAPWTSAHRRMQAEALCDAVKSAISDKPKAGDREEEAAARLPPSDFLHFVCRVLVVERLPQVELRAYWPFDVRGSAASAGSAAELGPGGQFMKTVERKGAGNGQRTSQMEAVEEQPESGRMA
ncbi:hypothetical protein NDU88_012107 [Pleurodeles waltl]|uniref:Uncharacterized protein n=1 Tax=Pleurodeles waltl TaxID=8319 RepID=A0AAV7S687_PLEWA|nr:hypothetical protein NDU88_012107 [Pleurodeles waltl]